MTKQIDIIYPSFGAYFITEYDRHTTDHILIVSGTDSMNIVAPHLPLIWKIFYLKLLYRLKRFHVPLTFPKWA